MTYPKFGATFFDLGLQLPRQILTKSKKFKNSKFFVGKFFLCIKAVDDHNTVFFKNPPLELQNTKYEKCVKQPESA